MTIKDLNLLEIDVYDQNNDKLIYNGMCEDASEELKSKQIEVLKMEQKKLIIKLV